MASTGMLSSWSESVKNYAAQSHEAVQYKNASGRGEIKNRYDVRDL